MLGGGGAAVAGQFPLEQWFYEMPVCTRYWTTATIATSVLVQCHVITPFQLFYSFRAVFVKNQVCSLQYPFMATRILADMTCFKVLAHTHNLPLLWPSIPRPPLPCLLPPTLLPPPRRIQRSFSGTFLMASRLCYDPPPRSLPNALNTFPRIGPVK